MGSSVGGALGNVVGQQDAGQIVGGVAGEQTLLKCEINSTFRFAIVCAHFCNCVFRKTQVPLLVPLLEQTLGTTWGAG